MSKPSGSIKCNREPVFAHKRMMLPVLGGISGVTKTTLNMDDLKHAFIVVK
jgi:hypothetical protein